MRAVVLGLVGAVLAAGGARAGECDLRKTEFVVKPSGARYAEVFKVQRPDLIGQRFRVVRTGDGNDWAAVRLKGDAGEFVVRAEVSPHTTPAIGASSWGGAEGRRIAWNNRPSKPNGLLSCEIGTDCVTPTDGPLTSLTLSPMSCN